MKKKSKCYYCNRLATRLCDICDHMICGNVKCKGSPCPEKVRVRYTQLDWPSYIDCDHITVYHKPAKIYVDFINGTILEHSRFCTWHCLLHHIAELVENNAKYPIGSI